MSDIPPTRRTDEPPTRDGAPLAGWPTTITSEQAASLQTALKQLQIALDAVVRERDEARAEVERLRADAERFRWLANQKRLHLYTDGGTWTRADGTTFRAWGVLTANSVAYPPAETLAEMVDTARKDQEGDR